MKGKFILLGTLLCLGFFAQAQQPFVMFAVKIDMQPSQVYNVFQLEDSTYRVFTRAGQIGSPVPYPPDGLFFDVSRDAKQIPFHRKFPVNTLGEYLPGDYYYTGLRYDSAGTRYSKLGLFDTQLKLLWDFRTPNNDVDLKLWPVDSNQYISVKQNGRILKFNKNGFIDSLASVQYSGMQWLFVRAFGEKHFVFSPWEAQWKNLFHDTLILIKSNLEGVTKGTYKYYQKDGLIFYSRFEPLPNGRGYELRFLTRVDSTPALSYFNYKIITLDSNLQEVQVKELDTALVNKYYMDGYYFTFVDARLKHGFVRLEQPRYPDGKPSNGFIIDVFNDNWELQRQTYITDSIIKANSKEYKSFDTRPWIVDVMKTTKDSGVIIAGNYKVGMFSYETLPFLIKTDTAGNVVWLDAGLGDFPAGTQEKRPVTEYLVLYPNPANDQIVITTQEAPSTIDVMDLNGKVLINRFTTLQQTVIDIQHLPSGIYFVKIINQNGVAVKRMMKTD